MITETDFELSFSYFSQACELKFKSGCLNLLNEDRLIADLPKELDLRLMLRQGGQNLMQMPVSDLYAKACEHDWTFACAAAENERRL